MNKSGLCWGYSCVIVSVLAGLVGCSDGNTEKDGTGGTTAAGHSSGGTASLSSSSGGGGSSGASTGGSKSGGPAAAGGTTAAGGRKATGGSSASTGTGGRGAIATKPFPRTGATGGSGGSGGSGSATKPACLTVTNSAPSIYGACVFGATVEPEGGTLVDGTYFMTENNYYVSSDDDCDTSLSYRYTLVVRGAATDTITVEMVGDGDSTDGFVARLTPVIPINGDAPTQLVLSETCPNSETISAGYTAQGNELRLYLVDGESMVESVFTRKP